MNAAHTAKTAPGSSIDQLSYDDIDCIPCRLSDDPGVVSATKRALLRRLLRGSCVVFRYERNLCLRRGAAAVRCT